MKILLFIEELRNLRNHCKEMASLLQIDKH